MKKTMTGLTSLLAASALVLAGCAQPPSATNSASASRSGSGPAPTTTSQFKACMVSDAGGFNDKSFNETAYNGMMQAKEEFQIQTNQIESNSEDEYEGNVVALVNDGCSIIITVGFALANATQVVAEQNPDVKFAIVDYDSFEGVDNAKGLVFNAAQPAFLAGYLAAAMSETGTVGTFGGSQLPTVTVFMDGFVGGVQHYNKIKNEDIKVLGWDVASQNGSFIGADPSAFGDVPGGKNTASTLISQGADIILPVAGPAGEGALQAAQESGGKVKAIWVDSDGYESSPNYGGVILTSVMKSMDTAVTEAIQSAMSGDFSSERYVGTLENEGVSLAPFHDFDSAVSQEIKDELEQIKKDIIDGKITIESPSQPS